MLHSPSEDTLKAVCNFNSQRRLSPTLAQFCGMAKATSIKEAIANFEKAKGVSAGEAEKVIVCGYTIYTKGFGCGTMN